MGARRGAFLPFLLIGVGVVALLANTGVLNEENLARLGVLWPLILVLVGADTVLREALPPGQARLAGLGVLAILVVAAAAYVAVDPVVWLPGPSNAHDSGVSGPVGNLQRGGLAVDGGGFTLKLSTIDGGPDLYTANWTVPSGDPAPQVHFDQSSGKVAVIVVGSSGFHLFGSGGPREIDIALNSTVPWDISIGGGGLSATGDLSGLTLTRLDVSGGAANVDLTLGAPHGTDSVAFSGGAFNITLRLPQGAPVRVHSAGGANSVEVAGQTLGAFGDASYQAPGYDAASDRYDIEISGGASRVKVS